MTDNPNYTPVDWEPKVKFPKGTPEYEAYEKDLKSELEKFAAAEPPYDINPVLAAIKAAGVSAADVKPVTISGYEPPASLDYFDVPEPKTPPLAEIGVAPVVVVVDGEIVGHLRKMKPAAPLDVPIFEIRDNREDRNIVATLNSLGHTVKLGDIVSHVATTDDRGTVEEIGSALIANTDVPNAVKVRWPSPAGIADNDTVSWHHVDNLTVIRCTCTHDHCDGRPGETDNCYPCLILDPEAPCLADDGGEA